MITTHTWTPGQRFCSTEAHRSGPTCPDCEDSGPCADCGQPVTGPDHLVCDQTGEVTHARCDRMAATGTWDDTPLTPSAGRQP